MGDPRKNLLAQWAAKSLGLESVELVTVSGDASFRRYYRFFTEQSSFIAVDAPPQHEDNQAFQLIANILKQNQLNVPTIHYIDLQRGLLILSDLGDSLYLPQLNHKSADKLYQQAVEAIITMLSISQAQLNQLPLYNEKALNDEMALFSEWFIKQHLQIKLSSAEQLLIEKTFKDLTENALNQPQHFVHRDFHSRNLMICEPASPGIIDFQDAVVGPITYDLVSLLKDCYIRWPEKQVTNWCLNFYHKIAELELVDYDFETFQKQFDLMGMQRHLKVLGIFCRLNYRDNKAGYLKDLPLTFDYLLQAVRKYPEFDAFYQFLLNRIQPLLNK